VIDEKEEYLFRGYKTATGKRINNSKCIFVTFVKRNSGIPVVCLPISTRYIKTNNFRKGDSALVK
jgi:hypothetical protein